MKKLLLIALLLPALAFAEGITISCMWQQHGPQVGGDIWPASTSRVGTASPGRTPCTRIE